MKKFIVPMMLGLLTVGGLTSCNINPTENITHNAVTLRKEANKTSTLEDYKVSSFLDGEVKNIVNSSPSELGIPATKFTPKTYDDFQGQSTFEYMGFEYTVTETNGTVKIQRSMTSSDSSTVEEIYFGEITGADEFFSMYEALTGFKNVKTVYGAKEYSVSMDDLDKLETLICNTNIAFQFSERVNPNFKNIVFTSPITSITGLEMIHSNVKFIASASVALSVRNALDEAFKANPGELTVRPQLYVIPDNVSPMDVVDDLPSYEMGGVYFSQKDATGKYQFSNFGNYVTKAVYDFSLIEEAGHSIAMTDYSEMYHVDELYYIQPNSLDYNFLAYLSADRVYLDEMPSKVGVAYYDSIKEVYFPETEDILSTVQCTEVPENTTFYIPKGHDTQYAKLLENQYLEDCVEYYDPSDYKPSVEVNYKGTVVKSDDLTVSAKDLLKEAMEKHEEEKEDLTPEEQEKLEEDLEAAAPVQTLIDSLGTITLDSKKSITDAKEAFEELSYDQQQLVENKETLIEAIKTYNDLVKEHNEEIEDKDDHLELIDELHVKNKVEGFIEDIKDNKAMNAVTVVAGTALGGLLLYGIYKLISKFAKWLKR